MQGEWKCKGAESGTVFNEVDLDEGEWVDYDEKVTADMLHLISITDNRISQAALPVGVSDIESRWTRA